jgi:hypothetical protein
MGSLMAQYQSMIMQSYFPYHNGKIRSGEVGLLIFGVVQEVKAVFLA